MSTIETLTSDHGGLASSLKPAKATADDESKKASSISTPSVAAEGIKVSLSTAGVQKAAGAGGKDRDIEESGLPEDIQQILKMIRKLQRQIAEKTAQLQAVMADKRLNPEQMRAKAAALQSAISGLSAGLITANVALGKALKQSGLGADAAMKAMSLATKS